MGARIPGTAEQAFKERVAELNTSESAYIRSLIMTDLGLSAIPRLATEVEEAIFEDFQAACHILAMLPEDLLAAIVQFHMERDETLLSREHFQKVYDYPHDYKRMEKST